MFNLKLESENAHDGDHFCGAWSVRQLSTVVSKHMQNRDLEDKEPGSFLETTQLMALVSCCFALLPLNTSDQAIDKK